MLDEALRRRIDAHRLDAGLGIQGISMPAEALVHGVLQEAVDEDHVAASEFLPARHAVPDKLAVMADELEIERLHLAASVALARRRLLDGAQAPAEGEVGCLDSILEQRSVDLLGQGVDEDSVTLEFRDPEWRAQASDHRIHQIRDDVVRMVELATGEKAGVAGNVSDHEAGGLRMRQHGADPPR